MYVVIQLTEPGLWRNQEKGKEPESHVILFSKFGKSFCGRGGGAVRTPKTC